MSNFYLLKNPHIAPLKLYFVFESIPYEERSGFGDLRLITSNIEEAVNDLINVVPEGHTNYGGHYEVELYSLNSVTLEICCLAYKHYLPKKNW